MAYFRVLFVLGLLLLGSSVVSAQLKLRDGSKAYYNRLVSTGNNATQTEKELLALPGETCPAGFSDTLKKYDWYSLTQYYFGDKKYTGYFLGADTSGHDSLSRQFDYFSVSSTGIITQNYYFKTVSGKLASYTITFDTTTASRLKSITTIKAITYMVSESYGEAEHQRIVSYRNGILVIETTRYGKPGEKPVQFRTAYMAMPKP